MKSNASQYARKPPAKVAERADLSPLHIYNLSTHPRLHPHDTPWGCHLTLDRRIRSYEVFFAHHPLESSKKERSPPIVSSEESSSRPPPSPMRLVWRPVSAPDGVPGTGAVVHGGVRRSTDHVEVKKATSK